METQGRAEQGREMQYRKHCVTQCERILRHGWTQGRAEHGKETQHGKHCVTQCDCTMRSSFL